MIKMELLLHSYHLPQVTYRLAFSDVNWEGAGGCIDNRAESLISCLATGCLKDRDGASATI
jgi:hypothetical protein